MKNKSIFVTRPSLPPLDEFDSYLQEIWNNHILTNNGELHKKLEEELCKYLGVNNLSLFCNGTIALITALKVLNITGDVITTPYSFVATAHSLLWNNLNPVFVDIDPITFNIDPDKIEKLISDKTTAIMPVHVYGNPCNVEKIQKIADKYSLKVIYDAAHAFGVKKNDNSILNYGDLSVLSFHATKVFSTIEGGAIICNNKKVKDKIDKLKNFGFNGETEIIDTGINGKLNEIQAAFGLMYLKHVDNYIDKRENISKLYRKKLKSISGITCVEDNNNFKSNYSYFPILIDDTFTKSRDMLYNKLKANSIFTRRYFYPLISNFNMYNKNNEKFPIAEKISKQVLCLPIYPDLKECEVDLICRLILE